MSNGKRILIVEDDAFTRFMIKQIIASLDADVEIDLAVDGIAGCEQFERNPEAYALILMDIHMPGISGIEATKRIRLIANPDHHDVPIVAVTADPEYHHPLAVESYGMNGFLTKPISPGALNGLIDQYCIAC